MKKFKFAVAAAVAALSCAAPQTQAYEVLENRFDVPPDMSYAEIWIKVRCNDGRVLKVFEERNILRACHEGFVQYPDDGYGQGMYEVVRE